MISFFHQTITPDVISISILQRCCYIGCGGFIWADPGDREGEVVAAGNGKHNQQRHGAPRWFYCLVEQAPDPCYKTG
uniref:Uncharacterized protein n=1 Tax=Triticum urartu TaxID=4572 RepID=A0A8R7TZX1_TRIUA